VRIVLVQPNLSEPQSYCPPLGICYLAACLRANGHEPVIVDMDAENLDVNGAMAVLGAHSPDVVGITSTAANAEAARAMGKALEGRGCVVVHGGPEPTVAPTDYLYANPGSTVLRGESEVSFATFVENLDNGTEEMVPGLSRIAGSSVQYCALPEPVTDIDSIPFPARDLCYMANYKARLAGETATGVVGSRSCPHRCIYCHDGVRSAYRRRSAASVVDELQSIIRDFGISSFFFFDCTLTENTHWVASFAGRLSVEE